MDDTAKGALICLGFTVVGFVAGITCANVIGFAFDLGSILLGLASRWIA